MPPGRETDIAASVRHGLEIFQRLSRQRDFANPFTLPQISECWRTLVVKARVFTDLLTTEGSSTKRSQTIIWSTTFFFPAWKLRNSCDVRLMKEEILCHRKLLFTPKMGSWKCQRDSHTENTQTANWFVSAKLGLTSVIFSQTLPLPRILEKKGNSLNTETWLFSDVHMSLTRYALHRPVQDTPSCSLS